MKISEQTIEAAAKALAPDAWDDTKFMFVAHGQTWDGARLMAQEAAISFARTALEAAAAQLIAQALREASNAYPLETAYGAEHAVLWLMQRAADIEETS